MTIAEVKEILLYNKKIWYNSKGVLTTTKNLYERAQEIPELKSEIIRFKDSRNLSLCLRNNLEEIPKCPYCGKDCGIDHNKTYRQTCGDRTCYQRAHEQTMLEKYGNKYTFKVPEIQEKVKETFLEKWGVENAGQSQEIKEKRYKTCLEKYGSITPIGNEEIRQKAQETLFKNHPQYKALKEKKQIEASGVKLQSQVILKTRKKGQNKKSQGLKFISPFSNPEVQEKRAEKRAQTMLKRYGTIYALQVPEFKQAASETIQKKYGTSWAMQSSELKSKAKQSLLEKYGVDSFSKTQLFQEKVQNTWNNKTDSEYSLIESKKHKKYFYKGQAFDSSWELAYYIFSTEELNQKIFRNKKSFKIYYDSNKYTFYVPDFWNETLNQFIEIKGSQYLTDTNELKVPYKHNISEEQFKILKAKTQAKSLFIKENNILLISKKDLEPAFNFIYNKYDKDYLKSFLVKR